jgi:hypothetical protein
MMRRGRRQTEFKSLFKMLKQRYAQLRNWKSVIFRIGKKLKKIKISFRKL